MRKTLAVFYVITVVLIYTAYNYDNNQVINAFTIDASKTVVENPPSDMLNTKQGYNFRLVNTSDKAVKLTLKDIGAIYTTSLLEQAISIYKPCSNSSFPIEVTGRITQLSK